MLFTAPYSKNENFIKDEIVPILLRISSIHNELGDRFSVGEGDNEDNYDLIKNYYPFNVTISFIGRFGQ